MKQLSLSIADFYVKQNIIRADEKEAYRYGIGLILNETVTFGIILLSATIIWEIKYAVEFLGVFCLTRVYCGGYHASNVHICRITMFTVFAGIYCLVRMMINLNPLIVHLLLLLNFMITACLIPVKHPNKELSVIQIRKNRKLGLLLYLLFGIVSVILTAFGSKNDGLIIGLSLCAVTVLAIIGKILNERGRKNEKTYE